MKQLVATDAWKKELADNNWVSPAFPDTFGKLMSLLEVSDAEKAIHSGVQG